MGKTYREIDQNLRAFLEAQRIFFVATAPLDASGHVNLSPKGLDSLRVLAPNAVAYLDWVGSGVETIAHIRENGRIALMFCAFEGAPKIVRLHGRGEVIEPLDDKWNALRSLFPSTAAGRAIIRVAVHRISDSCGFGVPTFAFEGQRAHLPEWTARKGEVDLRQYQRETNAVSVDNLPGLRWVGE
jgi:hypothetical protein